jgi:hypothetical protein
MKTQSCHLLLNEKNVDRDSLEYNYKNGLVNLTRFIHSFLSPFKSLLLRPLFYVLKKILLCRINFLFR